MGHAPLQPVACTRNEWLRDITKEIGGLAGSLFLAPRGPKGTRSSRTVTLLLQPCCPGLR